MSKELVDATAKLTQDSLTILDYSLAPAHFSVSIHTNKIAFDIILNPSAIKAIIFADKLTNFDALVSLL